MEEWLYRTEQMLDYHNIAPEQRVRVAAMHLQGSPLQWYRWLVWTNKGVPPWGVFESKITSLYGGRTVAGYLGELSKLKQEGHTLEHYQEEFMLLLHQVQDLSEDFLVGCFISGLRDTIKYDIIAKTPL